MPTRSPVAPRELLSKRTVLSVRTTGTHRDEMAPNCRTICTYMSPSDGGKQEVDTMTAYPADLRECGRLDTRDVYLNQDCFRSS